MADSSENFVLGVRLDAGKVYEDLNKVSEEIARVKDAQKGLNDGLKSGKISMKDYVKTSAAYKDELSKLQKEQKGLMATTRLMSTDNKAYADTLDGQRQRLTDMQKTYARLDNEMRTSKGGEQFLKMIKEQSDAVKELEAAMGDNRRNVGNYPKAWADVVPAFGQVEQMMSKMGVSMDALATKGGKAFAGLGQSVKAFGKAFITPPIAIITVVVGAVMLVFEKLREAFKKNDDAMTALQRGMSAFQPIVTAFGKAFDVLAMAIGKAVEWTAKAVTSVLNLIPAYRDAAKAADDLVASQDRLQDTERAYAVDSAKRSRDIARLRAESTESKDLSAREAKLKEAIELERKDLADRKKIAAERLRLLEAEAKENNDTSDAMKDKIAQARAAMYQAEEEYYVGTKKLQKELNTVQQAAIREEEEKRKAAAEEAKRRAKEAAEERKRQAEDRRRAEAERKAEAERRAKEEENAAKASAASLADIRKQAEDLAVQQIEDAATREYAKRQLAGERELEALRVRLQSDLTLTAEAKDELSALILDKEAQLQADLQKLRDEQAKEAAQKEQERERFIAQQRMEAVEQMRQETDAEQTEYENARWQAQLEVWRLQMADELAQIDLTESERLALQQKWDAVLENAEQAHQDKLTDIEKKAQDERSKNNQAAAMAAADFMGTLSGILDKYGEQNEAAAKASKALALGKIAVETGVAMASGIAQAQSVPFPANIAAIATTITTILANVASAVSTVKGAKFSTGGVVGGGSYGQGDTVHAMLSPQEVVLNPKQTAQTLFAIANGAQVGSSARDLADVVVAAVAAQPAPVLQYSEFESFNQKRVTYNEIAKI